MQIYSLELYQKIEVIERIAKSDLLKPDIKLILIEDFIKGKYTKKELEWCW